MKIDPRISFPSEPRTTAHDRWVCWRRGVDRAKSGTAVQVRESVPIMAFVGTNGGGKTQAAIYTLLPVLAGRRWECANPDHLHTHGADCAARVYLSTEPCEACTCATTWTVDDDGRRVAVELAEGAVVEGWRRILSTTELRDLTDTRKPSPYYDRLRSFVQLLGVEHTDVLLDEVTGVASSSQTQSLPVQVENLIQQLRRRDARLFWTTPDYGNAHNRIRSVTKAVVYCTSTEREQTSQVAGGVWRPSRLFRWAMYSAADFDRFTAGKRERLAPMAVQWFWAPGHIVREAYDTLAAVGQLGAAAEGGMCISCGGSRSRPACTCPSDPDRLPPGVHEEVLPSGGRRRRFEVAS